MSSNSNNVCIFDIVLRKEKPYKLKTYADLRAQSSTGVSWFCFFTYDELNLLALDAKYIHHML